MSKYLVTREDLGSRVIGYTLYDSHTKEFVGMTEKAIIVALKNKEAIYGFVVEQDKLVLDTKHFYQNNLLAHSGMATYKPIMGDCLVNNFYTVVKTMKKNQDTLYEVVTSRHGRFELTEEQLILHLKMGLVQGGAWLDEKGAVQIAEGVCVETISNQDTPSNKNSVADKGNKATTS